jgi:hypothetical protein
LALRVEKKEKEKEKERKRGAGRTCVYSFGGGAYPA